jgi:putative Mn2+ efflux pump MntP
MNFFIVLALALALAMDAFAVSMGLSLSFGKMTRSQTFRLSFHFGFFQFMMPVVGWLAGKNLFKYIQSVDHWIAFGLLLIIGGKMIYESFARRERREMRKSDPTKGFSLILLSVATSIDALAVGLSLAALHFSIVYPAVIIGLVAFTMSVIGVKVGPLIGIIIGKRAELLGGLILVLIGAKILSDHL